MPPGLRAASLISMSSATHHASTAGGAVDPCACGVCGTEVPPLVGSMLTGVGLTLDAAATRLEQGVDLPPLTDVQRRLVEAHAEARALR